MVAPCLIVGRRGKCNGALAEQERMAWEVALLCDHCKRKYRLRTGDFRHYAVPWQPADLPAWERVGCSDQDGWCHRCCQPRAIELVQQLEELEQMRKTLQELGHTEELPRAEAKIRWRLERKSPPRCLHCGSTAAEPMAEGFRHPGCVGRFAVAETPCHLNTSISFEVLPKAHRSEDGCGCGGRASPRGTSDRETAHHRLHRRWLMHSILKAVR